MRGPFRYALLGLFAFLGFLLLQTPATLVIDLLTERLPGFSAQTVEGSAPGGTAAGVRWRNLQIDQLRWSWRPLALFTGWLEFSLKVDDPELRLAGQAALNPGRDLRLRQLVGTLPLARLAGAAGYPGLPAQGTVELNLAEVRLNPGGRPLAATGIVRLQNLQTTLGQPLTLGDFTAELKPADPEGIQGVVQDNNGPLALEGAFSLTPDGRYQFTGHAAVPDANNRALRQAMSLLGPPGGDGRWILNFSGKLSF